MAVKIAPDARRQFVNASGVPYSGAKLFYYAAGSTTKQNTYTTSVGNVANSNPIILDSAGRTPYGVWFTSGLTYKEVLAPSTDTDPPGSPIFTEDNLSGVNDTSVTTSQWVASSLTPTYVSATQFTVAGDQTTELHVGRRLQLTVTAGTVYGRISVSAYTTLTTVTLVMDSGSLDSGLSSFNWSILSAVNHAVPKISGALWDGVGVVNNDSNQTIAGNKTLSGNTSMSGTLAVTGAITPSSTNGIVGTGTNDNANAGSIGEVISSTVVLGSAVSLTTTTEKNVTSITLTPGDWDVDGCVLFTYGATTSITHLQASICETSALLDATRRFALAYPSAIVPATLIPIGGDTPSMRVTVATGTTKVVYLIGYGVFTVSTLSVYGSIWARRAR